MREPRITIAIPTFNRADYLRLSMASALEQDFAGIRLLVLDNASTDHTAEVVASFDDPRIDYRRNETNIGLFRNWNLALELNESEYLAMLPCDDLLLPGHVKNSIAKLDAAPSAGFSFCITGYIDGDGKDCGIQPDTEELPRPGLVDGLDYLERMVAGQNWLIYPPSVVMRADALRTVGPFDILHSFHSIDVNLYMRLASQFDIVYQAERRANFRVHEGQESAANFRALGGTGKLSVMAERTDAVAHLLRSARAGDSEFCAWLGDRLLDISRERSRLASDLIPELNLTWAEQQEIAVNDLRLSLSANERFAVIDEDLWDWTLLDGLPALPLSEAVSQQAGSPADSAAAIDAIKRLRDAGVGYVVFAWPAFWWLDYYRDLRDYLRVHAEAILRNSRIAVFRLAAPGRSARGKISMDSR